MESSCTLCEIWNQLIDLLLPDPTVQMSLGYTRSNYNRAKIPEIVTHIAHCSKEYGLDFNFIDMQKYSSYMLDEIKELLCTDKLLIFEIPSEFTLKLYEIDLWIFTNQLLSKLIKVSDFQQTTMFSEFLNDEHINFYHFWSAILHFCILYLQFQSIQ